MIDVTFLFFYCCIVNFTLQLHKLSKETRFIL